MSVKPTSKCGAPKTPSDWTLNVCGCSSHVAPHLLWQKLGPVQLQFLTKALQRAPELKPSTDCAPLAVVALGMICCSLLPDHNVQTIISDHLVAHPNLSNDRHEIAMP